MPAKLICLALTTAILGSIASFAIDAAPSTARYSAADRKALDRLVAKVAATPIRVATARR